MFGLQMIHEMDNLQREMNRFFHGSAGTPLVPNLQHGSPLKLQDDGQVFQLTANLPGLAIESLDINIVGRRLNLSAAYREPDLPEGAVCQRQERQVGRFETSMPLPSSVDTDRVEAEYRLGVLHITLPKAASALPKKITVKVA